VGAPVCELDPGAGDEILDRARDEHFPRVREQGDACARMNGNAGEFAVNDLTFTRVEAGAYIESQFANRVDNRVRTSDCTSRPVESGEDAVPGRVQLAAAEPHKLASDEGVMAVEQFVLGAVAELCGAVARADDVREEHGCQRPGKRSRRRRYARSEFPGARPA
jgi:hypothetical protein